MLPQHIPSPTLRRPDRHRWMGLTHHPVADFAAQSCFSVTMDSDSDPCGSFDNMLIEIWTADCHNTSSIEFFISFTSTSVFGCCCFWIKLRIHKECCPNNGDVNLTHSFYEAGPHCSHIFNMTTLWMRGAKNPLRVSSSFLFPCVGDHMLPFLPRHMENSFRINTSDLIQWFCGCMWPLYVSSSMQMFSGPSHPPSLRQETHWFPFASL